MVFLDGQGEADGEGRILFGLSPGTYLVQVPVESSYEAQGTWHFGGMARVVVEPGVGARIEEEAMDGRLAVLAADPSSRAALLSLGGTTEDGSPVGVGRLRGSAGRWEILGLPAGTYRISLAIPGLPGGPAFEREIRFDGKELEVGAATPPSGASPRQE